VHDAGLALGLSLGGGGGGGGDGPSSAHRSSNSGRLTLWEAEPGGVSSMSVGGAVKRERADEADLGEMVSSTAVGAEEDDDGSTRKKLRLTKEQSALLEDRFKEHSTLNPKQKVALAKQLNLRPRQVEVWFQNRRARTKLKQTEVDCEFLKRCCETLTEENRRLQRELQELRTINVLRRGPAGAVLHAAAGRHADHLPVLRTPGRNRRHRRRQGRPRQAQGCHPPLLQPLHPLRRLL
uniref:Homeobox domain-containing protein n=1 Tax=Aegilops tauschii subsp. strangulata TaxID=200361 RepID=A0A453IKK9_AEGTS